MLQDIVGRIRRLLLSPQEEWAAINGEPADMGSIYKNYVLPLVAFAAICVAAGFLWSGFVFLALRMIVLVAFSWLLSVYIYALIIDALAPSFGGQKDFGQAFKVAAYSPTAFWVASVFGIIPPLRFFMFLGLYSFYLLFVGMPKLMKAPTDKALLYTVAVIVCAAIATMVLNILLRVFGFGYYL